MKELSGLDWGLAVDNGLSWRETGLTLRAVRPGITRVHLVSFVQNALIVRW